MEILTELVLPSSFKMPLSISTVDAHFWSPAAKQSTATHCAIEYIACLERPPDCGDGLALARSESNSTSKLVFAEWTNEAKNLCRACNVKISVLINSIKKLE